MAKITKVLAANRGEIAIRIFRAAKMLRLETVAVYTHVDRGAPHVRYADEAFCISDNDEDTSYLKPEKILEIAKKTGAAIHPGYGFLSENADFVKECEKAGVVFIGPSAQHIVDMGSKTGARKIMSDAGVPIVPGTKDPIKNIDDLYKTADNVGLPVMLKAVAGGGGKGMRLVHKREELEDMFNMAVSEAERAFGNGDVYIEKYVEQPHHVEVQIIGDKHGNVIHFYDRECSIQRRHQKVIEEAPSPYISPETRQKRLEVSVNACKKIGYYSAGTLEYMVDKDQNFYFLEMNTRLQVEHPVTEMITGVDLVRDMISVANGDELPYKQDEIIKQGHAIECRIYAEDPENGFIPSPGVITVHEPPTGRNVRVDHAAHEGYNVPLFYDPMIAKLTTWGRNRERAIQNMERSLLEYKILGIKTTIPFHQRVMKNSTFLSGIYDTTFIDTKFDKEDLKRRKELDPTVAIVAAALMQYISEQEAAAKATTVPEVGESLWKHYGKMQKIANRF